MNRVPPAGYLPDSLILSHCTLRRLVRVGACPVLEVCVTYPVLSFAEDGDAAARPAVARFNEAYRAMAEAFLAWATDGPAREAVEAFSAAGAGAVYRFDRRMLLCHMTVEVASDADGGTAGNAAPVDGRRYLRVKRSVSVGTRRGLQAAPRQDAPRQSVEEIDLWRWPSLTLASKTKKFIKEQKTGSK